MSADDPDCNGNKLLTYQLSNVTLQNVPNFRMDPTSGKLCIDQPLDYEQEQTFQFAVFAVDSGKFKVTLSCKSQGHLQVNSDMF